MEITVSEHVVRISVVALHDRVDAFNAPALRARLDGLLVEGYNLFVLDLSEVSFLDSAGMAVLVSLLKQARGLGGDVKLVWPQLEAARRILQLTKLDRVFDIADTTRQALGNFGVWHG